MSYTTKKPPTAKERNFIQSKGMFKKGWIISTFKYFSKGGILIINFSKSKFYFDRLLAGQQAIHKHIMLSGLDGWLTMGICSRLCTNKVSVT